ncbi:hypothetical protein EVAR_103579_1 [Eumeta japonica]|uniref:Uncharacterized protein n=1 Tax=Eumeta variegata TaxID=151549 RepID=A0A4C1ZV92_EUMVA|nr:hypothetical protein EVAR_103579_1 [Eumeta japonica]
MHSILQENDLVLKIEEDVTDEVTIKQELDIKPTVIQPKTLSCPLPPVTSVFSHTETRQTEIGHPFRKGRYKVYDGILVLELWAHMGQADERTETE